MKVLRDIPYALFLPGMAAIIGCAVAIPRSLIAHNWIGMLVPAIFSGAAFVQSLWSLRARGLGFGSTVGEHNAGSKVRKVEQTKARPASSSMGRLFYLALIPMALSVLVAFAWIAIHSYHHGQPIDGRIWIGFAMGSVLILMAFVAIRRPRQVS